ncbi:alpha/beta fold hydrolase [Rhodoplanes sp. Z2-YC6860]|uniref:alpha/beta fold hydrolase n=1 Tax=Rhodoplanes sp. Z2-YC6860 TaxID=674703 RepID=UPI00078D4385|nr:alpha/beta hydrolase [Rhodoplanes sp. Z2-YC6860]AMN40643.1 alpha/beta hydrolase fold protein [Rhodoplanes sp. Z2-YC6860]
MDFIEINGTALRYELTGSGPSTLVLIHEMGGTLESWDLVLPLLSDGRTILRYDTRGAGLSQKVRAPLSIDTMADDLVALMDRLGIKRAALAGVAVGGAIALHTAVRHAERVAAVVASSPAVSVAADKHVALLARVERMEREGLQTVIDTLDNGYPAELRTDAERFASFRARWLGGDPISYGAIYRMLIATDLQPELSRIRCPVLLTAGALDRVRPPHLVEPVAKAIPGARYLTLQAAHYAPVQTPELYAQTIGEFLKAVGA